MSAIDTNMDSSSGRGPRCSNSVALVVEDDDAVRAEIADVLRDDGYDVLEATEGRRALRILREGRPIDLILLDLWMPGMDGWSFRAEQLADAALKEIPVVVLTADDSAQARAIDADAVIRKPFEGRRLCRTVRQVISERRAKTAGMMELLADTVALLAGAVSHEIANPLMALIGGLEQARGAGTLQRRSAASRERADEMLDQCWRIAGALRTLRDLPYPHETREGDVEVGEVLRAAVARIAADDVRIVVDADARAWVRGERLVVLYVCMAVMRNAVEALPIKTRRAAALDGGPPDVEIGLHCISDEVVLEVRDRGPAVADEDLARVFTVDYAGRERAWGTGIRLWFARRAVQALRGSIGLANEPDGRVLCWVRLPALRDKTPHEQRNDPSGRASTGPDVERS